MNDLVLVDLLVLVFLLLLLYILILYNSSSPPKPQAWDGLKKHEAPGEDLVF